MSKVSRLIGPALVSAITGSCSAVESSHDDPGDVTIRSSALTAQQRLDACAQDPRVVTGLATAQVCAGAAIFFQETFNGNGRTCGSCHPAQNNFTIDSRFVATLLFNLAPNDPATIAASAIVMAAVAAVAGYLPARAAARVDPMVALRDE